MFSCNFHLECELISLEQENQKRACAVDIQTFKGLLRTLDDPEDVKRIFGKNFVLAGASTDAAKAEANKILRLLLSVFLIVMALLRSLRISIGAAPPSSFSIDSSIN